MINSKVHEVSRATRLSNNRSGKWLTAAMLLGFATYLSAQGTDRDEIDLTPVAELLASNSTQLLLDLDERQLFAMSEILREIRAESKDIATVARAIEDPQERFDFLREQDNDVARRIGEKAKSVLTETQIDKLVFIGLQQRFEQGGVLAILESSAISDRIKNVRVTNEQLDQIRQHQKIMADEYAMREKELAIEYQNKLLALQQETLKGIIEPLSEDQRSQILDIIDELKSSEFLNAK